MKVDGSCLCGYLTFEAEVDPKSTLICNCTDCRTLSGSAFRVTVEVTEGSFRFLSGAPKTYVKVADSGTKRALAFCPECGTSIYTAPVNEPGFFGLRVGSLRQRASLVPRVQYWCHSAQPWIDHIGDIRKFDRDF